MIHRIIAAVLFLLSLGGIGLGYLLLHPELIGWCNDPQFSGNCLDQSLVFGLGVPLYWSTHLLPLIFFALIFVRREVFITWAKVLIPFAVLGIWLILVSPPLGDPLRLEFGRTEMTKMVVQFLAVLSMVVIAWKYWRLNRKK